MMRYVFRRIAWAIPNLLVISAVVFGLNKCTNEDQLGTGEGMGALHTTSYEQQLENRREYAHERYLDRPVFYITITSGAFPDSFYKVFPPEKKIRMEALINQTGNARSVYDFEASVDRAYHLLGQLPNNTAEYDHLYQLTNTLFWLDDIQDAVEFPQPTAADTGAVQAILADLKSRTQTLKTDLQRQNLWSPAIYWNGFDNQYHIWLRILCGGNMGMSVNDKPVWQEIRPALYQTMLFNFLAFGLAFALAIPMGVRMARYENQKQDIRNKRLMLIIIAIPLVWLGAFVVWLFATKGVGLPFLPKFNPEIPSWETSGKTLLGWFFDNLLKFILPIVTLGIHYMAFLSLQMRGGMLEVLQQDYIRTARAKGLDPEKVYWKHAFRVAVFPIIALFASIFPAMIAGSVILESIFQIRGGLGAKLYNAFNGGDYSVIVIIVMMTAFMTVLGNLLADFIYGWLDPRIRLGEKKAE